MQINVNLIFKLLGREYANIAPRRNYYNSFIKLFFFYELL